jgi:hypothetical protein
MSDDPLRRRIEAAKKLTGLPLSKLSVLSAARDPYRLDTPAGRRDGAWLVGWIERLAVKLPVHLRGLFYILVAAGMVTRPDGRPFINDDATWTWLSEGAAKAARWLGLLPFESIVDERNAPPEIYVPLEEWPAPMVGVTLGTELPDLDQPGLCADLNPIVARQPYRLVLVGEKVSLKAVLQPLARRIGGELALPSGEMSDSMANGIASRAARDGRPCRLLYFADFDPSGWQMPISVARKLQAEVDREFHDLDIDVHRVGLLAEHVERLGLPSTPLKESERRADRWRQRWGLEQTEIDALAALRPDALREIAEAAVAPFFDPTLAGRCAEARWAWREDADATIEAEVAADLDIAAAKAELAPKLAVVRDELEALREQLEAVAERITLPPLALPQPELPGVPVPKPLWSSTDDWVNATRLLIADRAHAESEAPSAPVSAPASTVADRPRLQP